VALSGGKLDIFSSKGLFKSGKVETCGFISLDWFPLGYLWVRMKRQGKPQNISDCPGDVEKNRRIE